MVGPNTGTILVDSRTTTASMLEWARTYTPSVVERVRHYSGERPLFDTANVDEEIARALSRRVDLKSGGYLIIDQTEALTTVDVNTGGFVGGRNFDDTIFKTNLEAAQAIARQLRLRNLGGIVILDFIDMEEQEHRDTVLAELKKALSRDRTRMTVNGFTQLGLVEMTRKRTRDSLAHQLCEPCPMCEARGNVRTPRTVCYEILREILREARQFNPGVPHPRLAGSGGSLPGRGKPAPGHAGRFRGQARVAGSGKHVYAREVRHHPGLTYGPTGRPAPPTESGTRLLSAQRRPAGQDTARRTPTNRHLPQAPSTCPTREHHHRNHR